MTDLTPEQKKKELVRLRVSRWRKTHSDLSALRQSEYNRTHRAMKKQRKAIRKAFRGVVIRDKTSGSVTP